MKKFSRREVLIAGMALTAGVVFSRLSELISSNASEEPALPKTKILGLGLDGGRFKEGNVTNIRSQSLLSELDLNSGEVKQTLLNLPYGHSITPFKDKFLLSPIRAKKALIIDKNHKVVDILLAPYKSFFGGHAAYIAHMNMIALPIEVVGDKSHSGTIQLYDDESFKLIDQIKTTSYYPHDILIDLLNTNLIHIGSGTFPREESIVESYKDSAIVQTIDVANRKIKAQNRAVPLKGINHLAVNSRNILFSSQLERKELSKYELAVVRKKYPNLHWELGTEVGTLREQVPIPAPILAFEPNGNVRKLMEDPSAHLRHQSIAYNSIRDEIYATYSESNSIVTVDSNFRLKTTWCKKIGIDKIRGICHISGSSYLAVNDSHKGVAVIDAETHESIKFFSFNMFKTRHIIAV